MNISVKKIILSFLIASIVFLMIVVGAIYLFVSNIINPDTKGVDNIAVINISGPIVGGDNGGMFSTPVSSSGSIMAQINKAKKDDTIKGLLLRVNSPGGSSAASDAIYRELKKFQATGKAVVVSMGDMAASGGYYVSMASDEIYANPATMTGSIGVIMQFTNLEELYNKVGIDYITIKSRKYKDLGNPDRKMTEGEKEILQTMVEGVYQQFVNVVIEGRGMEEKRVKKLADGRVYSGEQAKSLGLVDELGNFYDAVDYLAELVGIEGEPNLVYYNQLSPIERLLSSFSESLSNKLLNKFFGMENNFKNNKLGLYYR
ncbi:signal peptide peptidase SppA [Orenia marismortui]|uniref:Signal peptide peptidase A n=1 Tax=Orenia marismortui TaxID=46469 RepID=A0A4R8GNJ8_9FIRM|nr:signal peptide peptidase SppA [Orenia marismortui]TDX43613.1 signal peptide peptidase A [Orenia marismortui]